MAEREHLSDSMTAVGGRGLGMRSLCFCAQLPDSPFMVGQMEPLNRGLHDTDGV